MAMVNNNINSDWEKQWLDRVKDTCDYAYKGIEDKSLQLSNIQGIIRHLPVIGIEDSLSPEGYEECLDLVAECFIRLWNYCKERDFVKEDTALDDFIKSGLNFSFFKGIETSYSCDVPKDFEKLALWVEKHSKLL